MTVENLAPRRSVRKGSATAADGLSRLGVTEIEKPGTFDMEEADWDPWVLEHGIPELPSALRANEMVPVAIWRCDRWAAIVHLSYNEPDPDMGYPDPSLDTEVQTYHRDGGAWVMSHGAGGGSWSDGVELERPTWVRPHEAHCLHKGTYVDPPWACGAADGVAGTTATQVEVEQAGRTTRCDISSPLGVWVVAFDAHLEARVRVLAADDAVLLDRLVPPMVGQ